MTLRSFALHPYVAESSPTAWRLEAAAARDESILAVSFRLKADMAGIVPLCAQGPGKRCDGLWRETCFEAFVAVAGESRYVEVNLAPTRDWNVYLFDGYRCGMRPDPSVSDLQRSADLVDGILAAAFSLPLASLAPGDRVLEVGLATVIRYIDGRLGHWALAHPGDRPDFHRREGFLLRC